MAIIYNRKNLRTRRKQLRNNMPTAELMLWAYLKTKRLKGYKFRRQYSVANYIIDFYCVKAKLGIEIDGDSHFRKGVVVYDRNRQREIEALGIKVIRFTNKQIYENINEVIEKISSFLS